jgi:hypothetical protein
MPPLLQALQSVIWSIGCGRSVKDAFQLYLETNRDPLTEKCRELWILKNAGQPLKIETLTSHYQRAFWDLIERGTAGQPVHDGLRALEEEVAAVARAELDEFALTLPFRSLIPLLAFQFPAFLILLLGPLLRDLQHHLGG